MMVQTAGTKSVYWDPAGPRRQRGFRGFAAARWIDPSPRCRGERPISEQLYWGLFELGLVDELAGSAGLAAGELEPYREGTLRRENLERVATLLDERANTLARGRFDWLCGRELSPESVEYRIAVPADALVAELRVLASFVRDAANRDYAVEFVL